MHHEHPQDFEREWWGTCQNTYGEETKQFTYAKYMELMPTHDGTHSPFSFDVMGKSIVDIGGGPSSLLLKCRNLRRGLVADPCEYPDWVAQRYEASGIEYLRVPGERLVLNDVGTFDEAWVYNVLQHVDDPERVVYNARALAYTVRLFEWIDIPPHEGHPHMLTEENLNAWLGTRGTVGVLKGENECYGTYYTAVVSVDK
jgi:hypothetical protein